MHSVIDRRSVHVIIKIWKRLCSQFARQIYKAIKERLSGRLNDETRLMTEATLEVSCFDWRNELLRFEKLWKRDISCFNGKLEAQIFPSNEAAKNRTAG